MLWMDCRFCPISPVLPTPQNYEQRVRFTEIGFNAGLMLAGQYNESSLVHEGAAYYELARGSGWVQLSATGCRN